MRNKSEGNRYELSIIKELKEIGYDDCVSSRSESRAMDNDGIDIVSDQLPFYAQMKSSTKRPNYHKLITEVGRKDKPLVVFHKQTEKANKRFMNKGEYVTMTKEFFYELLRIKMGQEMS